MLKPHDQIRWFFAALGIQGLFIPALIVCVRFFSTLNAILILLAFNGVLWFLSVPFWNRWEGHSDWKIRR